MQEWIAAYSGSPSHTLSFTKGTDLKPTPITAGAHCFGFSLQKQRCMVSQLRYISGSITNITMDPWNPLANFTDHKICVYRRTPLSMIVGVGLSHYPLVQLIALNQFTAHKRM